MLRRPPSTRRLAEATGRAEDDLFAANPWYEWGPYLSERAWGTVREDYSASGDAWSSFPHDHARSRAYRWNEDGMAGISDIRHELCLALALWNGSDPILKERMFGLTGPQGNHGEDVKEYWWYLDGLPSHALLRWRYHYPQAAFPYERLVDHGRGLARPRVRAARHRRLRRRPLLVGRRHLREGVADRDPDADRGREPRARGGDARRAADAVVPQHLGVGRRRRPRPRIERDGDVARRRRPRARRLPARGRAAARTARRPRRSSARTRRTRRASSARAATTPYPKDGINDHVVSGAATVNPDRRGTKAALPLPPDRAGRRHGRAAAAAAPAAAGRAGRGDWSAAAFDEVVAAREADADEFYARARAGRAPTPETMRILRQACAGLVWSKQIYPYNVRRWLDGDPGQPPPPEAHRHGRNSGWRHLDVVRRARDAGPVGVPVVRRLGPRLPRHRRGRTSTRRSRSTSCSCCCASGSSTRTARCPAYEWNFDDVNPPVHVMAALRVFVHRRRPRPRVPRARLPEAAGQLHVVAQPRGRRRQQPLRRRLPRPRQHQPDRPLEPARRASRSSRPTARRGWPTTRSRCS